MDRTTDEIREFAEIAGMVFGTLFGLLPLLLKFAALSIRALLHPAKDPNNWRFAWAYFVFPVVFVGGFGAIVAWALMYLLPGPWDWMITFVWLFYIWVGEPFMFYIEGDGFESWSRWVRGEEE